MANKRMFSSKIIESSDFLDLEPMSQLLYMHLCMFADDDGVVNNAKRVCRMIGARPKHLTALMEANYILEVTEKLHFIEDFRVNNNIRGDRYTPSIYQDIVNEKYPGKIPIRNIKKNNIEIVSITKAEEKESEE